MRKSVSVLSMTATLALSWAALAQQSSTNTNTSSTNSSGQSGNMQTISCTERGNSGSSNGGSTGASGSATSTNANMSTTGNGGSTTVNGTANTTAGSNTAGSTTDNTGSTAGSTAGNTAANTGNTTVGSAANTTGSTTAGSTTNAAANTTSSTSTTSSTASQKTLNDLTTPEVCFLDKAASSNQFEIESSQLALQKTNNADIKKLAQKIIDDHQAAGDKLKALAAQYNAQPSTQLNAQQQQLMTSLQGLNGTTFDITYLAQQISAHNEAIVLFKSYSQPVNSPDESVRQFASQTLPVLENHLQMALDQQKSMGSSSSDSK